MSLLPQDSPDFRHHGEVLKLVSNHAHARLLDHVGDTFPTFAELVRRAGVGIIVSVCFERTQARPWGVIVLNPSAGLAFSVVVWGDKLTFDRETALRCGDDVSALDMSGIAFWKLLSDRLGPSLARSLTCGGGGH